MKKLARMGLQTSYGSGPGLTIDMQICNPEVYWIDTHQRTVIELTNITIQKGNDRTRVSHKG